MKIKRFQSGRLGLWLLVRCNYLATVICSVQLTYAVFYCKIHNYLILLNRQRLDKHVPRSCFHPGNPPPPTFHPASQPVFAHPSPTSSTKAILRGRPLVLSSSEDLLTAFLFFYA